MLRQLTPGRHEVDEVAHVEHLHGDPFSAEGVAAALAGRSFDVVVACYGRLRTIAEVLSGRCDRFVSVGGTPAYRGRPRVRHRLGAPSCRLRRVGRFAEAEGNERIWWPRCFRGPRYAPFSPVA